MTDIKTAIVTAGGSGLGAGAARALAKDGYKVAVLSPSENCEHVAREIGGIAVRGSNHSTEDLQAIGDAVMAKWGRVDVLVNSSGHGPKGPVLDISDEDWSKAMDLYLMNVVRGARIVTPIMEKQGGGSIINISTFAVFEPDALFPTSCVFRAGLSSFTKLFANEYAGQNIRMNNVLPGFIDSLPEKEDRRNRVPMGRYGRVEEFCSMIAYLASEPAGYITGQNFRIDGGLTHSV